MSFPGDVDRALGELRGLAGGAQEMLARFEAEIEFAMGLARARPEKRAEWQGLILRAFAAATQALTEGALAEQAVRAGEEVLAPMGEAAKAYTIHCVGHAHLDMNWTWDWSETVATANDTYTTVDRLMEEFPAFHFSQSQGAIYQIMKDYLPELNERVKGRVAEGRWEITASQWVEGDKNMASGESLCRHLLYTRRFFARELGLPYGAVRIDWEPDTFGHPHTLPTILNAGGVTRYYFHRGAVGPVLFWWQGKDGSRVLAFDDRARGYGCSIDHRVTRGLFEFETATGLKDYLIVYGVGDHGGGPTRADLQAALKLNAWPIFPNIKLGTTDDFFSIAEMAPNLPVVDAELNCVLEGCYTSQSNIKRANRRSEVLLVEAEACALLGRGLAGLPDPAEGLTAAWRRTLFSQFHDILPGSGVKATYEYAQGQFQETLAETTMVKTRALRAIAGLVDTRASCLCEPPATGGPGTGVGPGIGAGQGDIAQPGAISRRASDDPDCDAFVIFNPSPWQRSEVITTRLWNRDIAAEQLAVKDDAGSVFPAQVLSSGGYWGHQYTEIAFPAARTPGLGYRSYCVGRAVEPGQAVGCSGDRKGVIENEFLRVQVEHASGAVVSLLDKRTGVDLVPPGGRLGLLEYELEAPHPMTAWILGQVVKRVPLAQGATVDFPHNGPYLAAVRSRHRINDSSVTLTVALAAGLPRVDFTLEVDWLERGAAEIGVPRLRVAFPLALEHGAATFECPNGHVTRPTDPREVTSHTWTTVSGYFRAEEALDPNPAELPAQKWADLTGRQPRVDEAVGATLLNDSKYGHSVNGSTLRLTLLRSSYDPDPLPELGQHTIRFALRPHVGGWSPSDSTRCGYAFNLPFNVVSATAHPGGLPPSRGFAEILTANVMVSALKRAEDSDALIVRLYEMEGQATTARVLLDDALLPAHAPATETDLLEQPLERNTAAMQDGVLTVEVPAFGLVTVKIG